MTKYAKWFLATATILILYSGALISFSKYGDKALRGAYLAAGINQCPKTKFEGNKDLYSQFYEDYVLSYVFNNTDKGFYVDVGANDPEQASATKYFYQKGWRGMNFEPQTEYYNKLLEHRHQDINVNKAASNNNLPLTLYIPKGLEVLASTDRRIEQGYKDTVEVLTLVTEAVTLTDAFKAHNIDSIDFVKIDVEGHEDKVLEGLDLKQFRPKVIVLESISPTDRFGYLKFEPIMFKNGYRFGMSDDLNRYYYRKESPEFGEKFREINKCVLANKLIRDKFCQNEDYCAL